MEQPIEELDRFIKELNRLSENVNYWQANDNYRIKMHSLYSDFFSLKKQGKSYKECVKVFDALPLPTNEPEAAAQKDVLKSLLF